METRSGKSYPFIDQTRKGRPAEVQAVEGHTDAQQTTRRSLIAQLPVSRLPTHDDHVAERPVRRSLIVRLPVSRFPTDRNPDEPQSDEPQPLEEQPLQGWPAEGQPVEEHVSVDYDTSSETIVIHHICSHTMGRPVIGWEPPKDTYENPPIHLNYGPCKQCRDHKIDNPDSKAGFEDLVAVIEMRDKLVHFRAQVIDFLNNIDTLPGNCRMNALNRWQAMIHDEIREMYPTWTRLAKLIMAPQADREEAVSHYLSDSEWGLQNAYLAVVLAETACPRGWYLACMRELEFTLNFTSQRKLEELRCFHALAREENVAWEDLHNLFLQ